MVRMLPMCRQLSVYMLKRLFLKIAFAASGVLATASASALEEQYVQIETRPGVTQAFMLIEPAKPLASVILFAGGDGRIGITTDGIRRKNNFLVRSRHLFADQGFMVATVDAASDFQGGEGLTGTRSGKKHAQDITGVIAFLKRKTQVPVWVIGTSRGTISAANAGARIEQNGPDGIVLTATVTGQSRNRPYSVFNVQLKVIRQPVLIVHHKADGCKVSPYSGTSGVAKALKTASTVEVLAFEGGDPPQSGACDALSYHGFLGIESQVVGAIGAWIKRH